MNLNSITAENFEMDTLENIMKDLRNSRRALLTAGETEASLEEQRDELQLEVQQALDKCDLDAVSKKTADMKRVMKKLQDGTSGKEEQFRDALTRLGLFVNGERADDHVELAEAA